MIVVSLVMCSAPLQAQGPASVPTARQELPPTNDAKEIVRRALNVDQSAFQLVRNYTLERREELKVLDKNGVLKKHEINTYDVTILYNQPYSRRIRKDDKPLTDKDQQKEEEKLDKFVSERQNESPDEQEKRLAKQEKERQEERAFVRDIINAYDFRDRGRMIGWMATTLMWWRRSPERISGRRSPMPIFFPSSAGRFGSASRIMAA